MTRRCKPRRGGYPNGKGNGNGNGVWNAGTAVNVFAIFVGFVATMGGFFYLTRDELSRHETAINSTIPHQIEAEQKARESSRNEFLEKFDKLNSGVADLNTKFAVGAEQNKQIVQTLGQIRDQLSAGHRDR